MKFYEILLDKHGRNRETEFLEKIYNPSRWTLVLELLISYWNFSLVSLRQGKLRKLKKNTARLR